MRSVHHAAWLPLPFACPVSCTAMASPTASTSGGGGGGGGSSGMQVADEVPFHDICNLMERVSNTSGTERKKHILATFVKQWREAHARLHPADADTTVSQLDSSLWNCGGIL